MSNQYNNAYHTSSSGYASRSGLSARQSLFAAPPQGDQLQINIHSGGEYDVDDEIEGLREQVGRLKQVSSAIQEENRLTQQVMENLEHAMEAARLTMKKTMKRLNRAYKNSKSNHVVYVFLFALAFFFFLYAWNKVWKFLKWIF